ncbi:DNA oxidative demethylase AlkB [Marinobacter sp. C2H3]|uniref:DNA oxidative demethylase AlkB n=1 Tax=Marinobacter sp. C2H3 TaxID=3119003 RepID=UPI00300EE45C
MTLDLFDDDDGARQAVETLAEGAVVLRGFARADGPYLMAGIEAVTGSAPFRQMQTPGGRTMSAAMSCCGPLGWVTDRRGYRYQPTDPLNDQPWPAMPGAFRGLAVRAAEAAGYPGFAPDACLINRYQPGARMGLHQDRDEQDLSQPIVSVSLGLPMVFQFGGARRQDPVIRVPLAHGDVVVWGGVSRLWYHGVLTLRPGDHPLTGDCRYNLTFRKAR